MGADYYIYTEIKSRKNDSWQLLNGKFFNELKQEYMIGPTYVNGSRTYFSRTYDYFKTIGQRIALHNISPEIAQIESWCSENDTIICVSLAELKSAINKLGARKEFCGYVHKNMIWQHQVDEMEIDAWLSPEKYYALPSSQKKAYEFYEWDDDTNWPVHIKHIINLVNAQVRFYSELNYTDVLDSDVRIVCLVSY